MKPVVPDTSQSMQRVKVGMIGLAAVVLLIGIASIIFSAARHDRPVNVAGAANAAVVANIADATRNGSDDEPLADLGVAPGAASVDSAPANQQSR